MKILAEVGVDYFIYLLALDHFSGGMKYYECGIPMNSSCIP